jgi:hypothetical protein
MHLTDTYKSIFIEPDWVFQKYYSWQVVVGHENFRVLIKKIGVVRKYLVLSQLTHDQLRKELEKLSIFTALSTVTIKDFTNINQPEFKIAGLSVPHVDDSERLLNKYTFIVDLHQESDKLWANMNPDNKRVCKKAMATGMVVESIASPTDSLLILFFERYRKMAMERSLIVPDEKPIRKMFEDGRLTMFCARIGNEICTMVLIYSAARTSFFFHGVAGDKKNDGSAQLVHWKVIEHLKQLGQHWYDLGGVPEISDSNGIYRFKKSLGGEGVDLGPEFCYFPPALLLAKRAYKKFRALL